MNKTTYYEINRDVILSRAKDYYKKKQRIIKRKSKK